MGKKKLNFDQFKAILTPEWFGAFINEVLLAIDGSRVVWLNIPREGDPAEVEQELLLRNARGEAHNEAVSAVEKAVVAILRKYGFDVRRTRG
jgi:hypothetical protein